MSYVYPFSPLATTGRIDQGQDFGGRGPIYAIGDAKITKIGAPGWPGGGGVLYKLLDGPRRGQHVFVYEGIKPTVRAGQIVAMGQQIGRLIPGSSTGIEIGFANAAGVPLSHAEYAGEKDGTPTVYGKEMASFLSQLKKRSAGGFIDQNLAPAERRRIEKLASEEGAPGGLSAIFPNPSEAVSTVAQEVLSGLSTLLSAKAAPILLNVGLVGGGAFLLYFGVARSVGVGHPVGTPVKAAVTIAKKIPKVPPP